MKTKTNEVGRNECTICNDLGYIRETCSYCGCELGKKEFQEYQDWFKEYVVAKSE